MKKIDRRIVNRARLQTVYDNYQRVFYRPPFRPDGANFVPGVGDTKPVVLFIGEAPGADEDRLMMPFVGKSGVLLQQMLAETGIIQEVQGHRTYDLRGTYITNVVKYRPPDNKLTPEVFTPAIPLLRDEVNILNPPIVIPLGRWSTSVWLQTDFSMQQVAGQVYHKQGRLVMPMLHPSFVLRKNSSASRHEYLSHFRELKSLLDATHQILKVNRS